MEKLKKATVLVVDDHRIMREGIGALLRKYSEFEIIEHASDGRQALELVDEFEPDIVIMDIGMPNLNGIEATRRIHSKHPDSKIIGLSTHTDGSMVGKMIQAGASGYIQKNSAFDELVEGLNTIMEGKTYLCKETSRIVFSEYISKVSDMNSRYKDPLSNREREVLQLVAEGNTTRDIAEMLHLSTKTVDSHREHIMEKLGIRNIAGLTKYALRQGLTNP